MSQEEVFENDMGNNISNNQEPVHSPIPGLQRAEEKEEVPGEIQPEPNRGESPVDTECPITGGEQHGDKEQQFRREGDQSPDIDKSPKLQHDGCRNSELDNPRIGGSTSDDGGEGDDIEIEEDKSSEQSESDGIFWRELWNCIKMQEIEDQIKRERENEILETLIVDFILPSYQPMLSHRKKNKKNKKKWFKKRKGNKKREITYIIF